MLEPFPKEADAQVFWNSASLSSHELLGTAGQVDPLRLKGFTKANCPSFPKGNVNTSVS